MGPCQEEGSLPLLPLPSPWGSLGGPPQWELEALTSASTFTSVPNNGLSSRAHLLPNQVLKVFKFLDVFKDFSHLKSREGPGTMA